MRHNLKKFGLTLGALILAAMLVTLLVAGMTQGARPPLLPFDSTGDLFILDSGSGNILRITPDGTVTIEVTKAEIMTATGGANVSFYESGIAFDAAGSMYFVEEVSKSILKREPSGAVTVLTPAAAITAAGGLNPDALAFGSDGLLYVTDDGADAVLQVNPTTGAITMYVNSATFLSMPGITDVTIENGIVGDEGGIVYVVSDPPDVIFAIGPGGTPSVLASGAPFNDLDVFMTRAVNGNLIVADNEGADTIRSVTTAGVVSTFLSKAQLEAVTGAGVDLEGGIAFDSSGNFYVADNGSNSILKFDTTLSGSIWVTNSNMAAVTGTPPNLNGGIAFEVGPILPPPVGGEAYPVNKMSLLAPWIAVGLFLAGGISWYVLRRRRAQS